MGAGSARDYLGTGDRSQATRRSPAWHRLIRAISFLQVAHYIRGHHRTPTQPDASLLVMPMGLRRALPGVYKCRELLVLLLIHQHPSTVVLEATCRPICLKNAE